jgi:hypothetical protein
MAVTAIVRVASRERIVQSTRIADIRTLDVMASIVRIASRSAKSAANPVRTANDRINSGQLSLNRERNSNLGPSKLGILISRRA